MSLCACVCVYVYLDIYLVGGGQGRDPGGGLFRESARAAPQAPPPDFPMGKLGEAAGHLGGQNPGWAPDRARRSLQLERVEPQTDRSRQSPGGAAGVAEAEVRGSSARAGESRLPKCPKRALGGRPKEWQQRTPAPRPGPRHTPRGTGRDEGPFAGAATRPHTPRPLSPPTAPPSGPGSPARLHLPGAQSTPSFFNKTTLRAAPSTRTGRDPGRRPARRRPPCAPPPAPPLTVAEPRLLAAGERDGAGMGGPARPCAATRPRAARSDRRGARGASRVNRFGAGVADGARAGSRAPRGRHSPGCAPAANASSGWDFFCRCSRPGWKPLSSSWCPWPRFP